MLGPRDNELWRVNDLSSEGVSGAVKDLWSRGLHLVYVCQIYVDLVCTYIVGVARLFGLFACRPYENRDPRP